MDIAEMGFFNKLFRKRNQAKGIPEDSFLNSILSANEYNRIIQIVTDYFEQQGKVFQIERDDIVFPGQSVKWNLQNVAQKCHLNPPEHWEEIIRDYFLRCEESTSDLSLAVEATADFAQAASLLAVRIWPSGTKDFGGTENLVYREDLWDTLSTLVLDLPDTVQSVTPTMLEKWGEDREKLFEMGLTYVLEHCKPAIEVQQLNNGVKVFVLSGQDFFTTTYALLIDKIPGLVGAYGTLFCIPHRQILIGYPIESDQVVLAMKQMLPITDGLYRKGPGSISTHLYWYYQGKYQAITLDAQKKQVYIPPEFTDLLNKLAEKP
jgi:hypothetical protein